MLSDVRHAFRLFSRCRGFAVTAISMVALGIGATTAIFSIVDAAVLRPLPYPEPDRLVDFTFTTPRGLSSSVAPRTFLDLRENQEVFEAITAVGGGAVVITSGGEPEELRPWKVTADFFAVYRVVPLLGRSFGYDAERPGSDRVAVLGYRFWERRFGLARDVVGKTLITDGGSYEIIGVLPETFQSSAGRSPDVVFPLAFSDEDRQHGILQSSFLGVAGRLRAGVTIAQATAQMNVLNDRFEDRRVGFNKERQVVLVPMHETVTGRARSWMLMLLGSVTFVLLIACVNVASLFLAHGVDRVRELTVRAALGASGWRITRQVFAEALLIAVCGAALGVLLAWWGVEALRASIPRSIPRSATVAINLRVLGFASLAAMVTALVSGTMPAFSSRRLNLADGLKDGARWTTPERGRRVLGHMLTGAEIAAALVLLVGAALFIRSFARVMTLDPGFDTSKLYAMYVDFPVTLAPAARSAFGADMVQHVAGVPGVAGAAMSYSARPFSVESTRMPFRLEDDQPGTTREAIAVRTVTPEYLPLLGVPRRAGRGLESRDTPSTPHVAVVNASAVRELFPDGRAMGKRLVFRQFSPVIVGVVADARGMGREREPEPEVFVPMAQHSVGAGATLTIRLAARDDRVIAAVKAAVFEMVPGRPITDVEAVDDTARRAAAPRRFNMLLLTIFGVVALGIAATGIYGLMAYTVRRRTHEIGVRLALGARASDVTSLVLRQGALVIGLGIVAGLAAAWLLARTVQSFLFEIDARDPIAFGGAAAVIAAAGLVACWRPVHRASRVDPVVALRAE